MQRMASRIVPLSQRRGALEGDDRYRGERGAAFARRIHGGSCGRPNLEPRGLPERRWRGAGRSRTAIVQMPPLRGSSLDQVPHDVPGQSPFGGNVERRASVIFAVFRQEHIRILLLDNPSHQLQRLPLRESDEERPEPLPAAAAAAPILASRGGKARAQRPIPTACMPRRPGDRCEAIGPRVGCITVRNVFLSFII
jgi:hypothetical protein